MSAFSYIPNFALAALAAFWVGSVLAVHFDAHARLANRGGVRAAVAIAGVLPFVGAFVWLCVRPTQTRLERRQRLFLGLLTEELAASGPTDRAPPARQSAG